MRVLDRATRYGSGSGTRVLVAMAFVLLPAYAVAQEKTDWDAAYEKLLESSPNVRKKVESGDATREDVIKWLQFIAKSGDKPGEKKQPKATWGRHFPKTAHEYAKMVEPILGVPPKIDLSEAIEIPLFVNGKRTYGYLEDCDNKTYLGKATVSGSTMQRYVGRTRDGKPLLDVVWVAFGRNSSYSHKRFNGSVQMIGYHRKSGATAFFESGDDKISPYITQDKDTRRMRGRLPWIDDVDGFNTAFRTPGTTQCVQCHQNDPFIHDNFVDAAKMPGTDEPVVPVLDADAPYYVIGGDDWDMRTVHIEGNACMQCHRVGMSTIDLFTSNGWKLNEHMPPHDPGSLADDYRELLTAWQFGPEKVEGAEWIIPPARGQSQKIVGNDYPYKAFFNRAKRSGALSPQRKKASKRMAARSPDFAHSGPVSDKTLATSKEPAVTAITLTSDENKKLLSISQAGLTVYDWPRLSPERNIKLHITNPHTIAVSPNGNRIAIGGGTPSEDGTIEVFSWPELKPITKLEGHSDSVMSIAWQSDSTIASASLDKEVRLWDIESGKVVGTFKGHSRGVTTVRFLADKQTMLTAGIDQSIRVWNSETGELIRSLSMHTKPIHDVAVRPATDGLPMIASASDDRTVRLWQPTIGRMVRFAKLPVRPLNVEWLPDGSRVIAVCTDGKAYAIDPDTVEITQVSRAMRGWIWAMAVHEDGVAIGGPNGSVRRIRTDSVSPTPMTRFTPNFFAFQNGLGFGSALEEAKFLKELGFTGVCQVYDRGEPLAQRVAAYDATNMRVGSVYLNVNDEPITEAAVKPLAHRGAMVELTIQRMSPKTVDAVRQTAEMADRLGLHVALYPHHGFSIATMPQAIELAEKVDHPNLGIMFNLCHFLKNEKPETLDAVLEQAKPYLFAVSTSGADAAGPGWDKLIQPLDRGTFKQVELFKILKNLNYRGPVGLQCFGVKGDKRANLKSSMAAWQKILDTVNSDVSSKAETDE